MSGLFHLVRTTEGIYSWQLETISNVAQLGNHTSKEHQKRLADNNKMQHGNPILWVLRWEVII